MRATRVTPKAPPGELVSKNRGKRASQFPLLKVPGISKPIDSWSEDPDGEGGQLDHPKPSGLNQVKPLLKFFGLCLGFTMYSFLVFLSMLSLFAYMMNVWPECMKGHPVCKASDPVTRIAGSVGKNNFTFGFVDLLGYNTAPVVMYISTYGYIVSRHQLGARRLLQLSVGSTVLIEVFEVLSRKVLFSLAYFIYILSAINSFGSAYIFGEYLIKSRALLLEQQEEEEKNRISRPTTGSTSTDTKLASEPVQKIEDLSGNDDEKRSTSAPRTVTTFGAPNEEHKTSRSMAKLYAEAPPQLLEPSRVSSTPDYLLPPSTQQCQGPVIDNTIRQPGTRHAWGSSTLPSTPLVQTHTTSMHDQRGEELQRDSSTAVASKENIHSAVEDNILQSSAAAIFSQTSVQQQNRGNLPPQPTKMLRSLSSYLRIKQVEEHHRQQRRTSLMQKGALSDNSKRKHLMFGIATVYLLVFVTVVFFTKFIFPLQIYVGKLRSQTLNVLYGSIAIPLITTGAVTYVRYQGYTFYYKGFYYRHDVSRNWFPNIMALAFTVALGQRMMNLQRNSFLLTSISGSFNIISVMTMTLRDKIVKMVVFKRLSIAERARQPEFSPSVIAQSAEQGGEEKRDASRLGGGGMEQFSARRGQKGSKDDGDGAATRTVIGAADQGSGGGAAPISEDSRLQEDEEDRLFQLKLDDQRKEYAVQSVWIESTLALILSSFGSIGAANAIYVLLPAVRSPLLSLVPAEDMQNVKSVNSAIIASGVPYQSSMWSWLCTPSQLTPFFLEFLMQIGMNTVQVLLLLILLKTFYGVSIEKEFSHPNFFRKTVPTLLVYPLHVCCFLGPAGLAFMLQAELDGFASSSTSSTFLSCESATSSSSTGSPFY